MPGALEVMAVFTAPDSTSFTYFWDRRLDQLFQRLAHLVVKAVGDVDRTSDGRHVSLGPIDSHGLVDGCVQVSRRYRTLRNIGPTFVAGPHNAPALNSAAANQ